MLKSYGFRLNSTIQGHDKEKQSYNGIDRVLNSHRVIPILALLFFSIPFVVYANFLLDGESIVGGDGITIGFYYMKAMGDSFRAGEFPLWTPYISGGQPLFNYYPGMMICSLLPVAIQIPAFFGMHLAIGGVFLFLYLKQIGCAPSISLAVAIIYLFTVYMGGPRKEHVLLVVAALYVPMIFFLIEKYLQREKFVWLFASAVVMAWQLIGGHLQCCFYSDILAFFYVLYFTIHRQFERKRVCLHISLWISTYILSAMVYILPVGTLLRTLKSVGGTGVPYDVFAGYSIHPIKLLMTVFPYIFDDEVFRPLIQYWPNAAGELDIELLIGATALALIIAGILLFKSSEYSRFMSLAGFFLFLYAALDHIPFLGHIIYHIPIINAFRCPARTLFLFTFASLVLLALSLNALFEDESHERRIEKVQLAVFIGMLAVLLFLCSVNLSILLYRGPDAELLIPWGKFGKIFTIPFVTYIVYLVFFYLLKHLRGKGHISGETLIRCIALATVCVTIFQTWPFYIWTLNAPLDYLLERMPQSEEMDAETAKTWVYGGWDAKNYTFNRGIEAHQGVINSYSNYQTHSLYKFLAQTNVVQMNLSGLYQYPYTFIQTIKKNNGILSAFGVKYLLASPEKELEKIGAAKDFQKDDRLLSVSEASFSTVNDLQIAEWDFEPQPNTYYEVSFTTDAVEVGEMIYVDFYGIGYDNAEQQADFVLAKGKQKYTATILSGDPTTSETPIKIRIISSAKRELKVSDVKLTKLSVQWEYPYRLLKAGEKWNLYENINAKPMLYTPDKISYLQEKDRESLYSNPTDYDFLHNAYLFSSENTTRDNGTGVLIGLELKNNSVEAEVIAENEALFVLSQTFYPGWHVYVDGEKTELFEVDGLMQGVFVPKGKHIIRFSFEPWYVYLGAAISAGMTLFCLVLFFVSKKTASNMLRCSVKET